MSKKLALQEYVDGDIVDTHAIARSLDPETFAALLDDYVNTFHSDFKRGEKTGKELRRSHRTLQRSVIVELVGIIAGISDQDFTDARNEGAIALAKKIKALYEEHGAGRLV